MLPPSCFVLADIKSANVLLTRWVVQDKPGLDRGTHSCSLHRRRQLASLCLPSISPATPSHPDFAHCYSLCRDGTAKVGDVGMAKIMAGDYVSGVVGTLAW